MKMAYQWAIANLQSKGIHFKLNLEFPKSVLFFIVFDFFQFLCNVNKLQLSYYNFKWIKDQTKGSQIICFSI